MKPTKNESSMNELLQDLQNASKSTERKLTVQLDASVRATLMAFQRPQESLGSTASRMIEACAKHVMDQAGSQREGAEEI